MLYIALTIVLGERTGNRELVWFGLLLAGSYGWMFVSTIRASYQETSTETFEATLVSLKKPFLLAFATANVTLSNGVERAALVRWRPVEALRRRGEPVTLVFTGTPRAPIHIGFVAR